MKKEALIEVQNLRVVFNVGKYQRTIIDDIDYTLQRGEVLGIVGESGSGKTQSAFALLGLGRDLPGIVDGEVSISFGNSHSPHTLAPLIQSTVRKKKYDESIIYYKNDYLWNRSIKKLYRSIRGRRIFLMFQDPTSYLNPFWTVGKHFRQVVPRSIQAEDDIEIIIRNALTLFGLFDYERIMQSYPHELSGGMNQRVMIALGYACRPDIIIADEITTGLDVVNQRSVITHLRRMMEGSENNQGTILPGIILISHDLGFVSKLADKIFVMYAGQGVEFGSAEIILDPEVKNKHPYTRQLLEIYSQTHSLGYIEGDPPKLDNPPEGCRFHERCYAFKNNLSLACNSSPPSDFGDLSKDDHHIRCKLYE